jgi:alkanesulfonate monooxygenase SsuD/methylene tetrahydromethanopterin reductase-like flavin-dependent oxidoreductase (luciferase family)
MEFGTQFNTHITKNSVTDFVEMSKRAYHHGFQTMWLNDNARYRNIFIVLSAVATQVPIRLGTATLVPYFHQPMDLATKLATLSELCQGRELKVGIAVGDLGQTRAFVEFTKRLPMLRETVVFLNQALRGATVQFENFPTLTSFYRLNPKGRFQLAFSPAGPFKIYGGSLGPKSLGLAGEHMDGIVFPGQFLAFFRTGRMQRMLKCAFEGAARNSTAKKLRIAALVNVSIFRDRSKAREFALPQVAHSIISLKVAGFTKEDYAQLGVDPDRVDRLDQMFSQGATIEEAAHLVDDKMISAYYLAGTPEEVGPAAIRLGKELENYGIDEIVFSKMGPDYAESLDVLGAEVLPYLHG